MNALPDRPPLDDARAAEGGAAVPAALVAAPAVRAHDKGPAAERWASVLLRSAHLMAVAWLAATLAGPPSSRTLAASAVLLSGALMLGLDLWAGRIRLDELAGAVVLAKLGAVAWAAAVPAHAAPVFWVLVGVSAVSSHAPKDVRHWPSRAPR